MSRVNAPVRKQPLKVFRPLAIKPKSDRCADLTVEEVGPHRRMHAKRDIERTTPQFLLHILICLTAFGFIEDDKLDIRYVGH